MSNPAGTELAGQVAIVTGGASGIGAALGEEFARRGGTVVLADRQGDLAERVAQRIRDGGGDATAAALDVRDREAFAGLARDTQRRVGRIDYLFNNAGIGVASEIETHTAADWDDVVDVNLRGVIHGIEAVYPVMIAQRAGHIVNTASMAGLVPSAGEASYVATKYAVVGLTKALRLEARRHGVRASALCPGAIRTPILTGGRYGRIRLGGIDPDQLLPIWERVRPMAPATFARKALDAVLRDDAIIILPAWWKALWYLERLAPTLSLKLWEVVVERLRVELAAIVARTPPRPAGAAPVVAAARSTD